MQKKSNLKWWYAACGGFFGLTTFSLAIGSVPTRGTVTDDTVIYQKLSDIRAMKERDLNFDSDLARLNSLEGKYKENLPLNQHPRLRGPLQRVMNQKYRPQ